MQILLSSDLKFCFKEELSSMKVEELIKMRAEICEI